MFAPYAAASGLKMFSRSIFQPRTYACRGALEDWRLNTKRRNMNLTDEQYSELMLETAEYWYLHADEFKCWYALFSSVWEWK